MSEGEQIDRFLLEASQLSGKIKKARKNKKTRAAVKKQENTNEGGI